MNTGVAARHLPALVYFALGLIAGAAATPSPATSQNRGQYVPGVGGVDARQQFSPRFTTGLYYLYYNAGTLRNAKGEELPVAADYTIASGRSARSWGCSLQKPTGVSWRASSGKWERAAGERDTRSTAVC
ncbi:MAG: hypothetical protein ACRENU_12730 [Gemmatimonadaceae bacterium]